MDFSLLGRVFFPLTKRKIFSTAEANWPTPQLRAQSHAASQPHTYQIYGNTVQTTTRAGGAQMALCLLLCPQVALDLSGKNINSLQKVMVVSMSLRVALHKDLLILLSYFST